MSDISENWMGFCSALAIASELHLTHWSSFLYYSTPQTGFSNQLQVLCSCRLLCYNTVYICRWISVCWSASVFYPEDEDSMFFRNICNCLPEYIVLWPRRLLKLFIWIFLLSIWRGFKKSISVCPGMRWRTVLLWYVYQTDWGCLRTECWGEYLGER
jgi:hypothetical protein